MKYIGALLLFLLLIYPGHAAISNWEIDVSLNEDGTSNWVIMQEYNETVTKTDYFVFSEISGLKVTANNQELDCSIEAGIGVSIICNGINTTGIRYEFTTEKIISPFREFTKFDYRFAVTQATDKFSVIVRLPLGSAIAEKEVIPVHLQPFEPSFGREGSDGRRIFVEWALNTPKLGETIDVSIIFEHFSEERQFTIFAIIASVLVAAVLIFIFYFFKQKPIKDILPILTENERKVMEIVMREKETDQRKIVKETDYSKAKVSRIIHDLEKRGLVEKERKGRRNIIRMKSRKILRNKI